MLEEEMEKLLQQFQKQLLLYRGMHAAVEVLEGLCRKADFAREEELEELNRLLLKRREQMDLIEESQEEAGKIKRRLAEKLGLPEINSADLSRLFPSPQASRLLEALEQIGLLLDEIARLDSRAQASLKAKLNLVGGEIEKLQRGKKLHKAYKPAGKQKEGFFVDRNK